MVISKGIGASSEAKGITDIERNFSELRLGLT